MKKITVNASRSYDVIISEGLLDNICSLIKEVKPVCKAAIIADDKVANLYLGAVSRSLEAEGYGVCAFVFGGGEQGKTPATYIQMAEFLAKNGLHRSDLVVALGGGVTGDMAGFAAGTYMRGIDFVQVPTTLLAAVDSSVGGKTGVNLTYGKNLLGIFNQPLRVLFDPNTLATLPPAEISAGLGECVKYAVLEGGELWEIMSDGVNKDNIARLVELCIASKKRFVEQDERETGGARKLLNLGHTFGHAIEKLSGYTVPHGIAVVQGLQIIVVSCVRNGILEPSEGAKISALIMQYGFDIGCPYTPEQLAESAAMDKKASDGFIDMVIINKIGDCAIRKTAADAVVEFLR